MWALYKVQTSWIKSFKGHTNWRDDALATKFKSPDSCYPHNESFLRSKMDPNALCVQKAKASGHVCRSNQLTAVLLSIHSKTWCPCRGFSNSISRSWTKTPKNSRWLIAVKFRIVHRKGKFQDWLEKRWCLPIARLESSVNENFIGILRSSFSIGTP